MFPVTLSKQLFKVGVYTSALIWALFLAAHTIREGWETLFFKTSTIIPSFIFVLWLINLALAQMKEKFFITVLSQYFRYIFSYLVCLSLVALGRVLLFYIISGNEVETKHFIQLTSMYASFILGSVLNTIILLIQNLIILGDKKTRMELENAELKIKNVEATNRHLKQQIHPHFLFNSLSTLKALIKKHPGNAEDYLIKLSEFLRASLLSNTPNTVKLEEELKLCNDYLEMQKIRFADALDYTINIPDVTRHSAYVPVFSILPLLENAIKHNKSTIESPLHIQIKYANGRIVASNNIQPKLSSEPSTGLGLENLSERYRILAGDEVIIIKGDTTFSVSIKTLKQ